ncbi:hypothetical protein GCM10009750_21720 [Agromyces salentinus]|uniref:Uncharacterized protein n=1 Tax=Agromyces salentinus TaxID=269421 RepID=A0ABP4Z2K4_9MICO
MQVCAKPSERPDDRLEQAAPLLVGRHAEPHEGGRRELGGHRTGSSIVEPGGPQEGEDRLQRDGMPIGLFGDHPGVLGREASRCR